MATETTQRRAIGIVRVSQMNGRDPDTASPAQQRERIAAECERLGFRLLDTRELLDVSGGKVLANFEPIIEQIESGRINVVVGAYFDRLFRNLREQHETVDRIERAGASVLALDVGQISNGSAGQWLSGTILGAMAEHQRRSARERSGEAQRRAVERGIVPIPNLPVCLTRLEDGTVEPNEHVRAVVRAFEMRADGKSISDVRAYLAGQGIALTYRRVQSLLASPLLIGEIRFGKLENLNAFDPVVDPALWHRVQRVKVSRGRQAKSDRLLARLKVLRCGTCGSAMTADVQTQKGRRYPFYRCSVPEPCAKRVAIGAEIVERVVVEHVRGALANVTAMASMEDNAVRAERALDAAQAELDAAIEGYVQAGVEREPSAIKRMAELRAVRDEARADVDHSLATYRRPVISVNASRDWHRLTLDEQRALIVAVVERVTVAPSGGRRGAGRVTVKLFSE